MLAYDLCDVAAARSVPPGPAPFAVPGLPRWSAAVREMKAGKRNARLICIGDSVTAGHGAHAAGLADNNKSGSWPTQLATLLSQRGARASARSLVGNQNAGDVPAFDTRISFPDGTAWAASTHINNTTLGGYFLGTASTSRLRFDPGGVVDRFEITYALISSPVTLGLAVDGGAPLASVSTDRGAGTNRLASTTLSVSRGVHVLDIAKTAASANIGYVSRIVAYDSTQREIQVLNAGWSGATSTDVTNIAVAWNTVLALGEHLPDLVVICLGINDLNSAAPTAEATFKANIQALITASVAAQADVLLAIPNAIGSAYAANHGVFATWLGDLATTNGLNAPIDFRSVLGTTHTVASLAGYMRDDLHPNAAGYARMAEAVRRAISG